MSILFKISYGLYMCSSEFDGKHNGCIINTTMQQTAVPETVSITINKDNYTTELIKKSGKFAVTILDTSTKFDTIKHFGMQRGESIDKFNGVETITTKSGLKVLKNNSQGYLVVNVKNTIDMGTHYLFVGEIAESEVFESKNEPLTYAYYHANVKPKPQAKANDGEEKWICKICGYVHNGPLPSDFICPLCKHGVVDFYKA